MTPSHEAANTVKELPQSKADKTATDSATKLSQEGFHNSATGNVSSEVVKLQSLFDQIDNSTSLDGTNYTEALFLDELHKIKQSDLKEVMQEFNAHYKNTGLTRIFFGDYDEGHPPAVIQTDESGNIAGIEFTATQTDGVHVQKYSVPFEGDVTRNPK